MSWYYAKQGCQLGPVDSNELHRLAREGELLEQDLICQDAPGSQWVPASSIWTLFAVTNRATPPPVPKPELAIQSPAMNSAHPPQETSEFGKKVRRFFAPLSALFFVAIKYLSELKFLLPVLKTGSTMVLSVAAYAMAWGWRYAIGFVLLIFVHECGHLLVARKCGLKVGAPMFIPFIGALITLKEAPRNAWIEAQVGIGGPILGTIGAVVCEAIYLLTGNPLFQALAYTGFLINLFNLVPLGFLDGGRIVTALSPWLWLAGFVIMAGFTYMHVNFLLLMILALSLPRLLSLFKKKSDEERRYFEVAPTQRMIMAALYFGLVAFLVLGMQMTHMAPDHTHLQSLG
jgi:Zn-dependent protease